MASGRPVSRAPAAYAGPAAFLSRPLHRYTRVMTDALADRHCKPCEGGVPPLDDEQARKLLKGLDPGWSLAAGGLAIERTFRFPAYSRTLGFANAVAWIAITEGHHPVLTIGYDRCTVSFTTHAVNGLTDNDFICAAKVDRLPGNA
jgi:4a-hydroxytetrahydrobiopterin dehydratase